jgi:hypothetical protein
MDVCECVCVCVCVLTHLQIHKHEVILGFPRAQCAISIGGMIIYDSETSPFPFSLITLKNF